tara:strand:- start:198 stop:1355 length:1158 start_codon:yes stop_codon:yes gene_type:complete
MNLKEITKPITAQSLNETLAKRFGKKLNVQDFTNEQLDDARNKLRTQLSAIETNESFDDVHKSDTYQKSKLMLDVLNAEIAERTAIAEKDKKPDKDGDGVPDWADKKPGEDDHAKKDSKGGKGLSAKQKKLPKGLQKAIAKKTNEGISAKDKKTGKKIVPGTPEWNEKYNKGMKKTNEEAEEGKMPSKAHIMKMCKDGKTQAEICKMHPDCDQAKLKAMIKECGSKMNEGKEDEAELVMASKDMVDRVTSWMEDTAEMQTESMLELADAIRDEMGMQQSDAFVGTVKPALESMYTAMEATRAALTQGVGMLTGEGEAPEEDMGAELPAEPEADVGDEMEPTVDADEFAAAEAGAGGEEEAGRAKRESIEMSRRLGQILAGSKKKS